MSANLFGFSVSVKTNLREQVKSQGDGRNQNEYGCAGTAVMKIRIGERGLRIAARRDALLAGQARGAL